MGTCALELVNARGHGEGHGRRKGREAEIGDTGPRGRSILDENISLRRGGIGLTKLFPARANTAQASAT